MILAVIAYEQIQIRGAGPKTRKIVLSKVPGWVRRECWCMTGGAKRVASLLCECGRRWSAWVRLRENDIEVGPNQVIVSRDTGLK